MKKSTQAITCLGLLAACFGFSRIFHQINLSCCKQTKDIHIIDVHVMECPDTGWFDGRYVEKAVVIYDKDEYKNKYLVCDTIFPIVYSALFVFLGIGYRQRKWYFIVILLIAAGAIFDWGENFSFFAYLNNPSPQLADRVAWFTSMKSAVLVVNALLGLGLFFRRMYWKRKA